MRTAQDLHALAAQGRLVDLVLEGGGVKGIALLGAVLTLYDEGYRFARIAGTSAGAIVAALVAAFQRDNRDLHDLTQVMYDVPYQEFCGGSKAQKAAGPLGDAIELVLHEGIHKTDCLTEWLRPVLNSVGVDTFDDLRIDDPEGSLKPYQRYAIVVHTSDLTRKTLVRLPWDYAHYGRAGQDQLVVDAVRASMSIPFFFRPVQIDTDRGEATWVDGGLLSNFPITAFDRVDTSPPRWPTWGIKLSAEPPSEPDDPVRTALKMSIRCMETLLSDWNRYELANEGVNQRTVYVDTGGVSATDFGLDKSTQTTLLTNGQKAAAQFLKTRPTQEQWPAWN